MYAYPVFRRQSLKSTRLLMAPTEEAKKVENVYSGRAKPQEAVLAEASTFVTGHGGDPTDQFLVLAHCKLQFGMYQNQRFRWLLENSLGYALYLQSSAKKEKAHANPLSENKQLYLQYTSKISEMTEESETFRKKQEMLAKARETGDQGCLMVDFGDFLGRSMKEVYEDQSKEAQNLITYLVKADARPNTNMALFKAYVLQRRKSSSSCPAPPPATPSCSAPPRAGIQTGAWKSANVKALLARGNKLSPSELARKLMSPVKPCE